MNVDWDRINSFIDEENAEEQEWLKDMIVTLISSFEERLIELDAIMSKGQCRSNRYTSPDEGDSVKLWIGKT